MYVKTLRYTRDKDQFKTLRYTGDKEQFKTLRYTGDKDQRINLPIDNGVNIIGSMM